MLRHLAFFETLGETSDGSPDWHSISAGLLVLRLFDAWIDIGPHVVTTDMTGMRAIRDAIEAIDEGNPARAILQGILNTMDEAEMVSLQAVAPQLMAYGRTLHIEGRWKLSADVFRTVVGRAHPYEEPEIAIEANFQLGYVSRMSGAWDEASLAYQQAAQIGEYNGDLSTVFRAQVAEAVLIGQRGNLPRAETILDDVIEKASHNSIHSQAKVLALLSRGGIAHLRGEYERAIRFGYAALDQTNDPLLRDRALANIASSFADLGVREAARDANLILLATAQEQTIRMQAAVTLMVLASLDLRETVFEQYRKDLETASLSTETEVDYHLHAGQGYARFGHFELAHASLNRAMTIAAKQGLNKAIFQIEEAEKQLEKQILSVPAPSHMPSEEVRSIAAALSEMRALAGV